MKTTQHSSSSTMTKFVLIAMLALCGLAVSGCRTAEGLGEDMENAGEEIQDQAN